jgi:hypothetical protein
MPTRVPENKLFLWLIFIMAWFAVITQFVLMIANRTASEGETIIRFFSFFTIESNGLIAVALTFLLLTPGSPRSNFFTRASTMAAMTLYILVVGITYNAILRSIWNPQGLQRIVDELLHLVIPLLFFIYWFIFQSKKPLHWKNIFPWLLFPLLYCIYTLIRGQLSGYYPYPFMDLTQLGMDRVLVNMGAMLVLFLVISILLVGITKLRSKTG